jgi:hypothetical protein
LQKERKMGEFEEYIRRELQKELDRMLDEFHEDFERHWITGESGGGCREQCMFCKDEAKLLGYPNAHQQKIMKKLFMVRPDLEEDDGPLSPPTEGS